jgi:hypothetical protein
MIAQMPPELYGPAGALAVLAFLVLAMIRGDIVPGWVYKQEREQRAKVEVQALQNTEALNVLAKAAVNGGAPRAGGRRA